MAKGGSLENALVFRGGVPINEGGLRFDDEVARHKVREMNLEK
jgi:UDP-3-O-acyl-N-acetylglucosamine deacetylase